MKHIVWRPYWDYQKEERWLNAMAAKGFSLTDYSWCRYVFEETQPGAYTYKIDLLKGLPRSPESLAYLRFLEESGVEVVATYLRWVYLRQPASQGPLELYTDKTSLLNHYRMILGFWSVFILLELAAGLMNFAIVIASVLDPTYSGQPAFANLFAGLLPLAFGIGFIAITLPIYTKYKRLKREQNITE